MGQSNKVKKTRIKYEYVTVKNAKKMFRTTKDCLKLDVNINKQIFD